MSFSKKISHCRSCKKKSLKKILSLGELSLTGLFPKKRNAKVPRGKLTLLLCNHCNLVQLSNNFDLNKLYGDNYGYRSSLNSLMVAHLKLKAKKLKKFLKPKSTIIDIGSNDGTFLSFFSNTNKLYGVDPTIKKFKKFYKPKITKINDFFPSKKLKLKRQKVDLFTSVSCFYDLPSPVEFAKNIYKNLKDNGIWHLEQSYLPSMLKSLSFDTVCHEHLEYYSLTSIKYIFDQADLKIIDIEFNDINGGSFALNVAKKKSKYKESYKVKKILLKEKQFRLNSVKTYNKYYKKFISELNLLQKFIIQNNKKKLSCLGASTKGNVLLQVCKLNSKSIDYIYEVNKDKFNCFSPGSKIKIINEKKLKIHKPDFLIVLPWHFKKFFIKNKIKLFNDCKLIFPLPKFIIK